jgi:general secretion pathway protein A
MYERFFGLADVPFRLTPDPRYLFLSRKHAEALAHLQLGLKESSGFVCITGDVGTGKTTLLRAFLAGIGLEFTTAYIFNPTLSPLELLQAINKEFGLPSSSESPKALVDALNMHLLAQRENGRRAIVVVDEAQALSIEVLERLRLLSNLETTTEKLLRIVLVGQPQLRLLLLHPELVQLNQRITLRWHLGPLDRSETAAYLRHRLEVASGGQAPRIFTRPAIRLVHRRSRGVPRLINLIAHRAMLAAFADDRRLVTRRCVRRAYREIGVLPLAPASRATRRLAWATVGATACFGAAALGAWWAGWRPDLLLLPAVLESPAPVVDAEAPAAPEKAAAAGMPDTPPAEVPPAEATVVAEAPPPLAAEGSAPNHSPPAATAAEVPPAAPEATDPHVADATPLAPAAAASPPPRAPEDAPEQRLARAGWYASARTAVDALLAAWRVHPLAADESPAPNDLAHTAQRRGLEYLSLMGNSSMLRMLDLPAIIELRIPEADGPRYAALTGLDGERFVLVIDGSPTPVDRTFLERHWFGQAHLLWRDFEALGPTFGRENRGAPVARLQSLLRRAGAYSGPETGRFDDATTAALLEFQRSRYLAPDGRVGRFTRIVLYAAAGGYPRPTLASQPGATS